MQRPVVERLLVGDLDQLAQIHHRDAVADVLHHGEVVGDEQIGEAEALLQILQQVDDLRLDRDVERRHRLVADDQVGIDGERAGDADALALPAGELVRIAPGMFGQQADDFQQLAPARGARRGVADLVHPQRLGQDFADGHARIERGVGVLEDDLHVPAQPAQLVLVEVGDLLALEAHRARRRVHQAQDQASGGRLAAAGFADQRQRLAAGDLEADVLDGAHEADHLAADQAAADREMLDQAVDLQDRDIARGIAHDATSTGAFQHAT